MISVSYIHFGFSMPTCSKEMFLQSEAKSRLTAQIAAKYDWRGPKRILGNESRPKPSFLNTVNQVKNTNTPLCIITTFLVFLATFLKDHA